MEITLDFKAAYERIKGTVKHTPLIYNDRLSEKYGCELYLKREDLQTVRSYKLRGKNAGSLSLAEMVSK